jgi:integrase
MSRDSVAPLLRRFEELLPSADYGHIVSFVRYMTNGPRRLKPDTQVNYLRGVLLFVQQHLPDADRSLPEIVRLGNITRTLTSIDAERASFRRHFHFGMKAFARSLRDYGELGDTEYKRIADDRAKFESKPKRHVLKEDEFKQLVKDLSTHVEWDILTRIRSVTIFATFALTGLRNSELCALRLEDVNFDSGAIKVVNGKGGKPRTVGLSRRLEKLLKIYLEHRPHVEHDYFFVGPEGHPLNRDTMGKCFQKLSKVVNHYVHAHAMRRTFATISFRKGVTLDKLQVAMGHADMKTTMIYIQVDQDEVAREMRDW